MSLWRDLFELILPEEPPEDAATIERRRAEFDAELRAAGVDGDELYRWRSGLPVDPTRDGWKENLAEISRLKASGINGYNYEEFSRLGLADTEEMRLLVLAEIEPETYREYLKRGVSAPSDMRLLHGAGILPQFFTLTGSERSNSVLAAFRNLVASGIRGDRAWDWAKLGVSDHKTVVRLMQEGVYTFEYEDSIKCGITDLETIIRLSRVRAEPAKWISVGVRSPRDMIEYTSLRKHPIGPIIYADCIEAGITDRREIRILLSHDIRHPKRFVDCGIRNVDRIVEMHQAGISSPESFCQAGVNRPDDMIKLARRGVDGQTLLSFVQSGLEDLNRIERFVAVGCTAEFWSELSGVLDDDSIAELVSIGLSASQLNRWPVKLLRRFGLLDPDSWRRFARAHGAAEAPPSASKQHVDLEQLTKVLQDAVDRGEHNLSCDEVLRRGPGIAKKQNVNASVYSYVKDDGWDAGEAAAVLNSGQSAEDRRAAEYRRLQGL